MSARLATLLLVAATALACAKPIVDAHIHEIAPRALKRIAVAPFLPAKDFRGDGQPNESGAEAAADAAALVTRFASEAFAAQGFEIVAAGDVVQAFAGEAPVFPHGDAAKIAARATKEFGATALLTGRVHRYRLRQGGELGATRPASVGYELVLVSAPDARKLWSARFDHTQHALSENLLTAPRYPGGGTRWLSAAELSRWGAEAAAKRLAELR